jgi:predicted nucleic acid-binding protein
MAVLLDTCVLIDLLRHDERAKHAVFVLGEQPCVCAVSAMELHAGAHSQKEERRIDVVMAAFRSVHVDNDVFRTAGNFLRHYRGSHGIDIPDALIAATAEHHGFKLATLNTKHFPMFKGLKPAY